MNNSKINTSDRIEDIVIDMEYEDLDINDKTILQEQFNVARHNYMRLIKKFSEIQSDIVKTNERMLMVKKNLMENSNINSRNIGSILSSDDDYIRLTVYKEMLEKAEKIITEQLAYTKSDIRILSNSMYNRF